MRRADALVMDRPATSATGIHETPAGSIKSILFHVHEDDELEARLQCALSLARACSAHLRLLQVIPLEAYTAVDTYGGVFASGEIVEALQGEAEKLRMRLEDHMNKEDVSWDYEDITSAIIPELLKNSAFADLVFMGRKPRFHEFTRTGPGLVGALLSSSRTPLCIPGDGVKTFDPLGTALIAWNGSAEGANAVRATIGLLRMASEVRVLRYTEHKEFVVSDERLLEYLSRHGIHAEIEINSPRFGIAEDLVGHAWAAAAQYMVMGGYSHSRAGEYLFGGVTRKLLQDCPVSLVMAH